MGSSEEEAVVSLDGLGEMPESLAREVTAVQEQEGLSSAAEALCSEALARRMDEADALRAFRDEFIFPKRSLAQVEASGLPSQVATPEEVSKGESMIYLCGNSLGLQSKLARKKVDEQMDKWAAQAVEGHFTGPSGWMHMDGVCNQEMADVVGAQPEETVLMGSLTGNLHLMMTSFYRPTATRNKILIESKAFPSDYIAARAQIIEKGYDPDECLLSVPIPEGESLHRTEDIEKIVAENADSLALVLLPGIQYYTGQVLQMERITAAVAKLTDGACRVGFDLAHAVGNVELKLHDWGVDFACWCTYKYLNSGPGGVGGYFVHAKHFDDASIPRLAGWWGHRKEDRFKMDHCFNPSPGAFGWQVSCPPMLLMCAVHASLEQFARATLPALRRKSVALTRYLELLIDNVLPAGSCHIITPGFDRRAERGAQLSLTFPGRVVREVNHAMEARGAIGDMREPEVLRASPAPIYNSYADVFRFVNALKEVLAEVPAAGCDSS